MPIKSDSNHKFYYMDDNGNVIKEIKTIQDLDLWEDEYYNADFLIPYQSFTATMVIRRTDKPWKIKLDYFKRCRASFWHKVLVLIGIRKSPTLEQNLRRRKAWR